MVKVLILMFLVSLQFQTAELRKCLQRSIEANGSECTKPNAGTAVSTAGFRIQFAARRNRVEGREQHQSGEKAADVRLPRDLLSRLGAER